MRWTEEEAKAHGFRKNKRGDWELPNAQPIRQTRVQSHDTGKVPELEQDAFRNEEGEVRTYRANAGRGYQSYRIVVTAHCRRHTDPDNLCPKYFIDRLKEFGIIPDDSSEFVGEFVKRVKKVEDWEPEITEIEVWEC